VKAACAALQAVAGRVRGERFAAVVVHERPDPDALGAAVGMVDVLRRCGAQAGVYVDPADHLPPCGWFLDEASLVPAAPERSTPLYVLDSGSLSRSSLGVESWGATVVNIDHHHDNTNFGELNLVRPTASSTSEIICDLYELLSLVPGVVAATGLYTGISFDSGHFRHGSTSAHTFRCAAWLVECGADPTLVFRELYEHRSPGALRLLARAIENAVAVADGRALVSLLRRADYIAAGADEDETEAIVDALRGVEGVEVAALVKEQSDGARTRVSLRSEGLDVSAIAARRGGGGHRQAAGFSTDDSPEEVMAWLSSALDGCLSTASS
jgi:phosphoesterase RecJ-like protein